MYFFASYHYQTSSFVEMIEQADGKVSYGGCDSNIPEFPRTIFDAISTYTINTRSSCILLDYDHDLFFQLQTASHLSDYGYALIDINGDVVLSNSPYIDFSNDDSYGLDCGSRHQIIDWTVPNTITEPPYEYNHYISKKDYPEISDFFMKPILHHNYNKLYALKDLQMRGERRSRRDQQHKVNNANHLTLHAEIYHTFTSDILYEYIEKVDGHLLEWYKNQFIEYDKTVRDATS